MSDRAIFVKNLQTAVSSGKCIFGYKEVLTSLKGSKLVIYSAKLPTEKLLPLKEAATKQSVSLVEMQETPRAIGTICGKHYPVSAMSIRSPGEADLKAIAGEKELAQ